MSDLLWTMCELRTTYRSRFNIEQVAAATPALMKEYFGKSVNSSLGAHLHRNTGERHLRRMKLIALMIFLAAICLRR